MASRTEATNATTPRKRAVRAKPAKQRDWAALIIKILLLIGLLAVGGSLGVISYKHGWAVSLAYGQTALVAMLMPLGVDGGLFVSAAAMIAPRTRAATRYMAKLTFGTCLAATLAQNGLAATVDGNGEIISDPSLISIVWSAIPGLIFVLVIDTAIRLIKDMVRKTTEKDQMGPLAKLLKSIKASRAKARRRTQATRNRSAAQRPAAPKEAKEAIAWVKERSKAATAA